MVVDTTESLGSWSLIKVLSKMSGVALELTDLDQPRSLDEFLASVEQRAYRMAVMALSDHDEALDVVQDTMIRLVRNYAQRPAHEWHTLFFVILHMSTLSFIVMQYSTSESSPVVATTVPSTVIDDLPIMTAQDDLQFYQDLDFIQWLAKDSKGGQS